MDEEQSNLTNTTKRSWVWNHFTFDENVKLLSTLLMVMTLFLLYKDIRRLIDFFFLNKVIHPKDSSSYHFKQKWKN